MLTTKDVAELSAKFNQVLTKRTKAQDSNPIALPYQNLSVVRNLSRTNFSVYLIFCKSTQRRYAMKVFPFLKGGPHPCFTNELRFSDLQHPNIINFVYSKAEKHILQKEELKKVSYILTEYAPYGDFFEFIVKHGEEIDDKLARTYFRQLIDGINYLHKCGIAHLDLKPENLLIGADFSLKIIDFDLSYVQGDAIILSTGTRYCRAPELKAGRESANPFAADIYCAGIILCILKSGGYAHLENEIVDGINFFDLMNNKNSKFWSKHCKIEGREKSFYDSSFKELFNNMVKLNPKKRICIKQIKKSKWYNGPVYTPNELDERMKHILSCSNSANHE